MPPSPSRLHVRPTPAFASKSDRLLTLLPLALLLLAGIVSLVSSLRVESASIRSGWFSAAPRSELPVVYVFRLLR